MTLYVEGMLIQPDTNELFSNQELIHVGNFSSLWAYPDTCPKNREGMEMSICVVVADSSRARIMVAENGNSPLVDEKDFIHPESRLREQDLVSDGPGSESDAGGFGKHSMGHEKAAHQKQAEAFAHELRDEIDKLRRTSDLRRIYLVASPKFLGLLRSSISKQCAELLSGEVNKDLVDHSIEDIRSHLPNRL